MLFFILLLIIPLSNCGMEIDNLSTVSSKKHPKITECFHCNKLISKTNLHLHLHRKHLNKNNKCFKCNKTFDTIIAYTDHMRLVEGHKIRDTDVICSTCNTRLKTFEHYLNHCNIVQRINNKHQQYLNSHNKTLDICSFCGKEYKQKGSSSLKYHLHKAHFNSKNKCFTCNIEHESCREYTDHCKLQHTRTLYNNKTIICPTCNTQLDSLDHFHQHLHKLTSQGRQEANKKRYEFQKVKQNMNINRLIHKESEFVS